MKILVLTGSPHLDGTSSYLAKQFLLGAKEKGHDVQRIDAASLSIKGCLGCNYCRTHDNVCVQKDAMSDVLQQLKDSDLIVFTTPIYCMGMSSQLKTVFDRFYSDLFVLKSLHKDTILMATCNDKTTIPVAPLQLHFRTFNDNLGWHIVKEIYAQGYNTKEDIQNSEYATEAYELGYSL